MQHEPRHELQGHLDEHAEGAEAESHGRQELGPFALAHGDELTRTVDELRADDLRRETAEGEPGAVGARRRGTGDRLPVDVAHVGQREPVGGEKARQRVQSGAGGERDAAGRDIRVDHSREVGEVELHVGGDGDAREAVA